MDDFDDEGMVEQEDEIPGAQRLRQAVLANGASEQEVVAILESIEIRTEELYEIARIVISLEETTSRRAKQNMICALIEYDSEVAMIRDSNSGRVLLHDACAENYSRVIRRLIKLYPEALGVCDTAGMVPLHWACCSPCCSIAVVQRMLSLHPESAKAIDVSGRLPLHTAIQDKAPDELITGLVNAFPEGLHSQDNKGWLPLAHAVSPYLMRPSVVRSLVDRCPHSARVPCKNGNLPLHIVCSSTRPVFVKEESAVEIINILTEQFPDAAQVRGVDGCLPIHLAARKRGFETLRYLVDLSADELHMVDSHGKLPLHHACENYHYGPEIVKLLIQRYESNASSHSGLDVVDRTGRIPLHYATINGNQFLRRVMQLLLNLYPEGAGVADNQGMLPLHLACSARYTRLSVDKIQMLIGTDILTTLRTSENGKTPLQLAFASSKPLDIRQFLLEKQDEALSLMHGAFEPTAAHFALPDLVVAEIWGFALPKLWRPTAEEMRLGRINTKNT